MIAIHTKYIKATNTRGERVKAYTASYGTRKGFSTTISYPYAFGDVAAHFKAVEALVKNNNLDWDLSDMRYGDSADAKGYSFCFNNSTVKV